MFFYEVNGTNVNSNFMPNTITYAIQVQKGWENKKKRHLWYLSQKKWESFQNRVQTKDMGRGEVHLHSRLILRQKLGHPMYFSRPLSKKIVNKKNITFGLIA